MPVLKFSLLRNSPDASAVYGVMNFRAAAVVVFCAAVTAGCTVTVDSQSEIVRDEKRFTVKGTADLLLSKHRNGPTGVVKLTFLPSLTQFRNYAPPQAAPGGAAYGASTYGGGQGPQESGGGGGGGNYGPS